VGRSVTGALLGVPLCSCHLLSENLRNLADRLALLGPEFPRQLSAAPLILLDSFKGTYAAPARLHPIRNVDHLRA